MRAKKSSEVEKALEGCKKRVSKNYLRLSEGNFKNGSSVPFFFYFFFQLAFARVPIPFDETAADVRDYRYIVRATEIFRVYFENKLFPFRARPSGIFYHILVFLSFTFFSE